MNVKEVRETVGMIAVVAGLFFVGWEVRQNTAVARVQAYHAIMADQGQLNDMFASDPILTPLMTRVGQGATPDDFDAVENQRIVIFSRRNLRGWEGLFLAVREGVLPSSSLDVIGGGGAFDNAYIREVWPRIRASLTPDFVDYMEERFGLGS